MGRTRSEQAMECLGPQCASMLLEWLKNQGAALAAAGPAAPRQATLWSAAPYQEEAAVIRDAAELAGALEHLEYAVFRRYQNQLTRAERTRLDNTIKNTLFKIDRHAARLDRPAREQVEARCRAVRDAIDDGRERWERLRRQARRAELKL